MSHPCQKTRFMWARTAQIKGRGEGQDMKKCSVTKEFVKDKAVHTRREIPSPLAWLGRCFKIRNAFTLEAHPTPYKPHRYHFEIRGRSPVLHPLPLFFLPRSVPSTHTNYGRVDKLRKLVKQHQPYSSLVSSFMALWVNGGKKVWFTLGLFFPTEILSSIILQVCTFLQWTETPSITGI